MKIDGDLKSLKILLSSPDDERLEYFKTHIMLFFMNVVEGTKFVMKPSCATCWEIMINFMIAIHENEQAAVDEFVLFEEFIGDFLAF